MEDLIEFRRPDGSTYFAKFPENEADKLVLPVKALVTMFCSQPEISLAFQFA
jgi:hypothetical protein